MPATLVTATNIAKEVYLPQLVGQLNKEVIGLRRVMKSSDGVSSDTGGKYVRFPIRVSRNPGLGYRAEGGALPTGGNQGYASVQIGLKYGYGMLLLSGQSMRLLKTNAQAFASVMSDEMDGLKNDVAKDTARIFYGDGTGALATLSAASQATANTSAVNDVQYLEVGQVIDIVSPGGTVRGSNRTITSITVTTAPAGTFVYSGADIASDATGDLVVRTGNFAGTVLEPNGLSSIVKATGALYNVDPATQPVWASVVDSNNGTSRALSESAMIAIVDRVRKAGGARPTVIFASLGVRRAYFNLLTQQRRYTDTKEFAGGFSGLAFNHGQEIPVIDDPDAPTGKMWFVNEPSLTVFQEEDWSWDDTDGSMWSRISGFDQYEARLYKYWEIGVKQRNANALFADITEN
jgi:hypothetical protein